jgi:hypothetical protein
LRLDVDQDAPRHSTGTLGLGILEAHPFDPNG